MSIIQILAILRARLPVIAAVLATAVLAAAVALMIVPKRYQAVAQLYVNASESDPVTGLGMPMGVMRGMVYDVMEGLKTRGIARQAVEDLNLQNDPAMIAAFRNADGNGDFLDWLSAAIQNGARIARVGMSNLVSITYEASSPEAAARFANAIAQAGIKKDLELRVGPSRDLLDWYDERIKPLRQQRETVAAALAKMREASGEPVGSSAEARASMSRELSTAQVELVQARVALQDARAGRIDTTTDQEIASVTRQLADLNQQIAQDTASLGPAHNRVRQSTAARTRLAARLQDATQRATANAARTAEQRVAALEKRVTELGAIIASSRTVTNTGIGDREREIETLDAQIQQLLQRREVARLSSAVERSPLRIMTEAVPPAAPSFPNVPILLGVAAALGLFIGIALAFLREMLDRRIRCPQDIGAYFEMPVLGTVPRARVRRFGLRKLARQVGLYRTAGPARLPPRRDAAAS